MRIVHFAVTPLAGAPLRIVQALNAHTGHEARLIDLRRYGTEDFGQDVVFEESPDLAVELAEQADIIHFHNYLDLDSTQFAPIDFRRLHARGTLVLRHFHSHPELVASRMGLDTATLLAQDIPSVVIGQFQERFYPASRVIPNFVPETASVYLPAVDSPEHDIFFSPTNLRCAWDCRWNTKGTPQTLAAITTACKEYGASWKLVSKTPLHQTLAAKRASRIVVDDLVTGSYHLTGLEALSQGKPVLAHLDQRTLAVMQHFSGTTSNPFITVTLEEALPVLRHLLITPEDVQAIGEESRAFMTTYWQQARMVLHLDETYRMLAHDPASICRQPELSLTGRTQRFFAHTLPDLQHDCRQQRSQPYAQAVRIVDAQEPAADTTLPEAALRRSI